MCRLKCVNTKLYSSFALLFKCDKELILYQLDLKDGMRGTFIIGAFLAVCAHININTVYICIFKMTSNAIIARSVVTTPLE